MHSGEAINYARFRQDYRNRYANARYRHGDEQGDNAALLQAIDAYRAMLNEDHTSSPQRFVKVDKYYIF